MVKTLNGEKPIEQITNKDMVYTTNGWESVISPTETNGTKLIHFKTRYSLDEELCCTPDHEILILPKNKHKGRTNGKWDREKALVYFPELINLKSSNKIYTRYYNYFKEIDPIWCKAEDIQKDDYALKRIDLEIEDLKTIHWKNEVFRKYGYGLPENIKINEDFCELIGIWLAEGSSNGQSISFTISKKEESLKKRILKLVWNVFQLDNFQIYERHDSLALNISYSSKQLISFFAQLFETDNLKTINQWNKRIPTKLKKIDPKLQLQIFKGWFLGDGYARTPENGIRQSYEAKGTTVSKELAKDMVFVLNRNLLNPTVIKENRTGNRKKSYNIQLYSTKAKVLYEMKYKKDNFDDLLQFSLEDRYEMDIPVIYNGQLYLKQKMELFTAEDIDEKVFCLMTKSQNFTVNDIIVHNCRGYRSEFYPDGIEVETAQFLSSLIPVERGFLRSIHDSVYGNLEKDWKPIQTLVNELNKYPGLLEIIESIEGLVCKRGQHASGVIFYNNSPFETNALMRSPNGDLTTQFELHDSDKMGDTKFDILVTEICDKITICIELLQKNNLIDKNKSLREIYNEYLHPAVLDTSDEKLWTALANGSVLDVFQFSTGVGLATAKQIKPTNPTQLTSANCLMRLMGEKGKERPIDRYCRLKNDISLWYKEVKDRGLTEKEIKVLEPYYLPNFGTPTAQEDLMLVCMDENIAHFTLAEANMARKIVAKKNVKKVPELKEKFISQCPNSNFGEYVWETVMMPQMSYAFAKPHGLAYSFVGIQTLYLATNFPEVFWNCACLIVNAGGAALLESDDIINDDEETESKKNKSVNYGKISTAIGETQKKGISVMPPDINKSSLIFSPDLEKNSIVYGLKGINRIGTQLVYDIILKRPYTSIEDFLSKIKVNKIQMISLIKSGAFDSLSSSREEAMHDYLNLIADKKKRITLQNMQMLITKNLIPEELNFEQKVFNFNKYLKKNKQGIYYHLDSIALQFYSNNYNEDLLESVIISIKEQSALIKQSIWDSIYKKEMDPVRNWMKQNQTEILNKLNDLLYQDVAEKYTEGSISKWEMDSLGFYYHDHELKNLRKDIYEISNFFDLPEEPEIERFFEKDDKKINLYKISRIAGTIVDKDKNKSSLMLLTNDGVLTVKVWKNQYALWDRQIARKNPDGTKTIVEKSFFARGNKIIITGIRRGDNFIPKKYKNTEFPLFEKIIEMDNKGFILQSQTERAEIE